MTSADCICPAPVITDEDGVRRETHIWLDDCPRHGEEARAGWDEEGEA